VRRVLTDVRQRVNSGASISEAFARKEISFRASTGPR